MHGYRPIYMRCHVPVVQLRACLFSVAIPEVHLQPTHVLHSATAQDMPQPAQSPALHRHRTHAPRRVKGPCLHGCAVEVHRPMHVHSHLSDMLHSCLPPMNKRHYSDTNQQKQHCKQHSDASYTQGATYSQRAATIQYLTYHNVYAQILSYGQTSTLVPGMSLWPVTTTRP